MPVANVVQLCTEPEHDVGTHSMTAVYAWCYGTGGPVGGYVCQACYDIISSLTKGTDNGPGRLYSFVHISNVEHH